MDKERLFSQMALNILVFSMTANLMAQELSSMQMVRKRLESGRMVSLPKSKEINLQKKC